MKRVVALILALITIVCAFAQQGSGPNKAELAKLQKTYATAKAAYTRSPKRAGLKKKYVDATVAYGTGTMTTPALPTKSKYKDALRIYREALKLDPTNKEAKSNSDMMIRIYKQLGRPVPKG